MNNLITTFDSWLHQGTKRVELLNKDLKIVASLYLDKLNLTELSILAPDKIDESYYLYINGVGIFFSYFRKN